MTIERRERNLVKINEPHAPHAPTEQQLSCMAAYAAQAYHNHEWSVSVLGSQ